MKGPDSSSPSAEHQGLNGREHDIKIQSEGDILDVEKVVSQLFPVIFQGNVIAAINLCPARGAGLNQPALFVERDLLSALHFLLGDKWPWPDEGHVAFHNVEQLRKLINASSAQPLANPGDAQIAVFRRCQLLL